MENRYWVDFLNSQNTLMRSDIYSYTYMHRLCAILWFRSDGLDSGSFVKERLISAAVSCMEAINDKYGKVEDPNAGIDESEAYLSQGDGSGRVINIEVVGMKKIGDLQR